MTVTKLQRQFWENLLADQLRRIINNLAILFIKNENLYVSDRVIAVIRNGEAYTVQFTVTVVFTRDIKGSY